MKQTLKLKVFFVVLFQLGAWNPLLSQVYQPIGIDTSCYWITEGTITDGLHQCIFEHALVVEKDTTINGKLYQKCHKYITFLSCSPTNSYLSNYVIQQAHPILREDSSAKILYSLDSGTEVVMVNFNLNVSDSLKDCTHMNTGMIDSVVIKNFNGTNRRVTYSVFPGYLGTPYIYETIEGIGSNLGMTCPAWGTKLKCYSKGGIELYNSTACPKPAPLATTHPETQTLTTQLYGQKLYLTNPKSSELKVKLINSWGQVVYTIKTREINYTLNMMELPEGMYIVSIESDTESKRFKIVK
ncbi:MAG: T9SS type A sorting domain-containing protein [Chitinophagaceae bacterium]|nr:T9SS type A sorting domain-containing protein [Chitinophagaceae bacterium]